MQLCSTFILIIITCTFTLLLLKHVFNNIQEVKVNEIARMAITVLPKMAQFKIFFYYYKLNNWCCNMFQEKLVYDFEVAASCEPATLSSLHFNKFWRGRGKDPWPTSIRQCNPSIQSYIEFS